MQSTCLSRTFEELLGTGSELQYIFGGIRDFTLRIFCVTLLVAVVDQMVLDPVNCHAEIHFTAVFALGNGEFSRLEGDSPYTPLNFFPDPGLFLFRDSFYCNYAVRSFREAYVFLLMRSEFTSFISSFYSCRHFCPKIGCWCMIYYVKRSKPRFVLLRLQF